MNNKWIEAYNSLFEIINQPGDCYYSGSRFLDLIREVNNSVPSYKNYIDERTKKGLSTSRKDFFFELLEAQNDNDKIQIYKRILEIVREFEPQKSQVIIDLLEINVSSMQQQHKLTKSEFSTSTELSQNEIESMYIDEVRMEGFYSIRDIILLNNLSKKKFIFLLGENGCGKTILLRSMILKLKENYIKKVSKEVFGIFEEELKNNPNFLMSITGEINGKEFQITKENNLYLKNCYAYGTNRNKISETAKGELFGFLTLFKDNEYLTNIEQWIKDIERLELKGEKRITVNKIAKILGEILEIEELKIDTSGSTIYFETNQGKLSILELSEGYRSIIILVVDLLSRVIANNEKWDNLSDFKAVVLIDELDLFLHPTWEKNICSKLHKWFPNFQFFITTHSPILIDGAVKDKELSDKTVVYRLENKNNQVVISEQVIGSEIKNWLPNILISSNLFDSKYFDNLPAEIIRTVRTENDYQQMLQTDENVKKLQLIEEQLKTDYLENLKKLNNHD